MTDTDAEQRVLIPGAGQAGLAAAKLRGLGRVGAITMVGSETHYPYQHPPFSKGHVPGDMSPDRLFLRPESYCEEQGIAAKLAVSATGIDREARRVMLSSGEEVDYDKLILTTGAAPIRLPEVISNSLQGVFYIRDLADADAIARAMMPGENVLVVGGGYIGLEGAAVANKLGLKVTLVEAGARILNRFATNETADYFRAMHKSHGVDPRENTGPSRLLGTDGRVTQAELSDGTVIACDVVLVGIGVRPDQHLAEVSGLELDNGIRTDRTCRTSDDHIFAAGDCASFPWNDT